MKTNLPNTNQQLSQLSQKPSHLKYATFNKRFYFFFSGTSKMEAIIF